MEKLLHAVASWPKRIISKNKPAGESTTPQPASTAGSDELFPSWPPPSPREMLSRRDFYRERLLSRRYLAPRGVFDDSPLFGLYRLYEWIMVDHIVNMRNELEMFWWARWPVADIPDPGEQGDPERYAVLACIPALLVESFNERVNLGLRREEPHSILSLEEQLAWAATPKKFETISAWAERVPPLDSVLYIPHSEAGCEQFVTLDDPGASPAFKEKNILAIKPHIHFI
ncbi:uncharacterized protein E0L32_006669 [Thyridium curvatum]|uniref:Uncharacterized protein n=1 Tax=Thyridium curvatum TaxID=1093900 RepID=A0A507B601_9PEZI|nr:uncharacterized protein E0L32_006669 [Thyridium curvatum]TPX12789.1 hypothetical protein E0L32_006669 [Thyridium curvatum]